MNAASATPANRTFSPAATHYQALEDFFVIASYIIFGTQILQVFLVPAGSDVTPITVKLVYPLIYATSIFLVFRNPMQGLRTLTSAPALTMLLIMPLLSVAWAVHKDITMVRAIHITGSSFLGIYLAHRIHPDRLLRLLAIAASLTAFMNLFIILAFPSIGGSSDPVWPNAWQGATQHKNELGALAAIGAVILLSYLLQINWQNYRLYFAAFLVNLLLVVKSQSTTAVVLAFAPILLIYMVRFLTSLRRETLRTLIILSLMMAVVIALVVSSVGIQGIAKMMGKSGDLTGRLPLWSELMPYIMQRYWLGYGYSSFWQDQHIPVRVVSEHLYYIPAYSHNGLIELWLNAGMVGILLFFAVLARFVALIIKLVFSQRGRMIWSFAAAFAAMFVMQNLSESSILSMKNIQWCLFIALYLSVIKEVQALKSNA